MKLALPTTAIVFALGTGASAADRGQLTVTATRGPVTPVCAIEVPCDGPAAGVHVVIRRSAVVVARAVTNRLGRVRLSLEPGRYLVTASFGGGVQPSTRSAPVRIVAGRPAVMRFSFDTGIR